MPVSKHIKVLMIQTAREETLAKYDTSAIEPCGRKQTLYECFTVDDEYILFWFNVPIWDRLTTKLITHPKSN